jgi:hypothetical protein
MVKHLFPAALLAFLLGSCGSWETSTAILWTDRPEFALYAESFNAAQDRYKIEVQYFESPAKKLTDTREYPDIVTGSWLKSASTRTLFRPLDYLLKDQSVDPSAFYSRLLALGRIEGKQYLFPVSFNLPALVFARDNGQLLSNLFVISPEEIKTGPLFLGKGEKFRAVHIGKEDTPGYSQFRGGIVEILKNKVIFRFNTRICLLYPVPDVADGPVKGIGIPGKGRSFPKGSVEQGGGYKKEYAIPRGGETHPGIGAPGLKVVVLPGAPDFFQPNDEEIGEEGPVILGKNQGRDVERDGKQVLFAFNPPQREETGVKSVRIQQIILYKVVQRPEKGAGRSTF